MQALTSSFPSSTRGQNGVHLDNIIFYSGPASAKTRETTPIDSDESSDVDMIFADASRKEWAAATEQLELTSWFDIMSEDIQNATDTSPAAQAATFTTAHLEDVGTPLCNPLVHSRGGVANKGGSAKPQELLDIWATHMEGVPAGISDTVELDVQHSSGDVGIAVQDCRRDDGASLALWEAFSVEVSISAPATDRPTSPRRILEADGPNMPLHTARLSPGSPKIEGNCVQQRQLVDDHERNTASPTGEPLSTIGQEDTSKAAYDRSANATPMKLQDVTGTISTTTGNEVTVHESHVSRTASGYPECINAAQLTPRIESGALCNSKSVYEPPENTESAFDADADASLASPSSATQPPFEDSEERGASTTSSIEAMQSGCDGRIPCDSEDEDESMPRKPPSRQTARVRSLANTQSVAETNRLPGALDMDCDEQEDDWPGVVQEGKIARQRKRLTKRSGEHHRRSLDRDCCASDTLRTGKRQSRKYPQNVRCPIEIENNDLPTRPVGRRGRPRKSNSQTTGRCKAKRRPASSHRPLPRQPMWEVDSIVNKPSTLKAATPKSSRNKPTWALDRIVGSIRENGKLFYIVRWEDTLEPAENLRGCADTAIAEFHLQHLL